MEEDAGLAFGLSGLGDTAVTRAVRGVDDIGTPRALAAARRPTEIVAFDEGVASGIARVSAEVADWPEVTEAKGCIETAGLDAFGNDGLIWPHRDAAGSSQRRNTDGGPRSVASRSAGLSQPRTFLGRWFSSSWTRAMSSAVWTDRSVLLGK